MRFALLLPVLIALPACGVGEIVGYAEDPLDPDARMPIEPSPPDAGTPVVTDPGGTVEVTTFPFHDSRDTSVEPPGTFDFYSCDESIDESGPEVFYHVDVPQAGFLSAAVYEDPGVDVDVHILTERDPATCVSRGNRHARADVPAGDYWVVVDTHSAAGVAEAGKFRVDIGLTVPSRGACAMTSGFLARVNDGGNSLAMPATGPIVVEAHLVTAEEPPPYPMTATDELADHYALSQARTGFVMHRNQDWAPLEGGSFYGAGVGAPADFPVVDEGWYVNMYWRASSRPAKGTRMILRDPNGGPRAVVVAGGYETGPGDLAHIAGTPEETHFYMGTTHLSPMTIGFAEDQALPLGPRICE
jgi:hypothetical protein